jgi:O-antigen ligase
MAVALALSPAYVIRPHVGPLPTTVLEIALLVAVAAGLYAFWDEIPWRNPYTWPALLLLAAATLDVIFAPDRRAAAGLWKAYFVEPVAAGAVVAAIASVRERARLLLAGLALGGTLALLANIGLEGADLLHHVLNTVTPQVAIYNTANAIPLYQEPLLSFALAIALLGDDRRERLVAGAYALLALVGIALSYSRAGWITAVVVAMFVLLFSRRRWLVALPVAAAGLLFALSSSVRARVLVEFSGGDKNTLLLRLPLWRSTLAMLVHRPLLGGGLAGFRQSVEPYRDPAYHEPLIYPHNLLLNFWTETGLLGLAAFLWLAVQAVPQALGGLALNPWARATSVGLLGLLLAFLVHGLVDVPYFKNDQSLAFWTLLGVQLGAVRSAASR